MRQNYLPSLLFMMASEGVVALLQILLDMGMNANENYDGESALPVMSRNGDEAVVKLLREYAAVLNSTHGRHNCTPLQAASLCGSLQVVKLLIDAGANVNSEPGECGNALQAVARKGHLEVIKHLIGVGADVHSRGEHLGSALTLACGMMESASLNAIPIVKILLEMSVDDVDTRCRPLVPSKA